MTLSDTSSLLAKNAREQQITTVTAPFPKPTPLRIRFSFRVDQTCRPMKFYPSGRVLWPCGHQSGQRCWVTSVMTAQQWQSIYMVTVFPMKASIYRIPGRDTIISLTIFFPHIFPAFFVCSLSIFVLTVHSCKHPKSTTQTTECCEDDIPSLPHVPSVSLSLDCQTNSL